MKADVSMKGLLSLIDSFSLSAHNKRWLGERLIEEAKKEEARTSLSASKFYGVWSDADFPELSADKMSEEIKASRKFNDRIKAML
jgi:hypothetical protein